MIDWSSREEVIRCTTSRHVMQRCKGRLMTATCKVLVYTLQPWQWWWPLGRVQPSVSGDIQSNHGNVGGPFVVSSQVCLRTHTPTMAMWVAPSSCPAKCVLGHTLQPWQWWWPLGRVQPSVSWDTHSNHGNVGGPFVVSSQVCLGTHTPTMAMWVAPWSCPAKCVWGYTIQPWQWWWPLGRVQPSVSGDIQSNHGNVGGPLVVSSQVCLRTHTPTMAMWWPLGRVQPSVSGDTQSNHGNGGGPLVVSSQVCLGIYNPTMAMWVAPWSCPAKCVFGHTLQPWQCGGPLVVSSQVCLGIHNPTMAMWVAPWSCPAKCVFGHTLQPWQCGGPLVVSSQVCLGIHNPTMAMWWPLGRVQPSVSGDTHSNHGNGGGPFVVSSRLCLGIHNPTMAMWVAPWSCPAKCVLGYTIQPWQCGWPLGRVQPSVSWDTQSNHGNVGGPLVVSSRLCQGRSYPISALRFR